MSNLQSKKQPPNPLIPRLVFDLKKNRIRIHKRTLRMLGNPDYIQFLVNPNTKMVAIRASDSSDKTAEKIKWQTIGDKQCCEYYSKDLIMRLKYYCYNWEEDSVYLIEGRMNRVECLVFFDLEDSVLLDNEWDEQELL